MTDNTKPRTDVWDDFAGEYLKADLVKEFPLKVVVKNIEAVNLDGKPLISVCVEYNKKDWKITLNKSNQNFLRSHGVKSPKEVIGKVLTFEKVKARTPNGQAVDSLLICDISENGK